MKNLSEIANYRLTTNKRIFDTASRVDYVTGLQNMYRKAITDAAAIHEVVVEELAELAEKGERSTNVTLWYHKEERDDRDQHRLLFAVGSDAEHLFDAVDERIIVAARMLCKLLQNTNGITSAHMAFGGNGMPHNSISVKW